MLELSKEQKYQIIDNRRMIVARNVFELQVDIVVMSDQGRTDDVNALNARIAELQSTDAALLALRNSIE